MAKIRALKDTSLGWSASFLNLDKESKYRTRIFATGGRFFLTGTKFKAQTGYNDIQFEAGKTPGFFVIFYGTEARKIYLFLRSHHSVHYYKNEKDVLLRTLKIEPFVALPFSVFVGIVYVRRAGAEYFSHHNLLYFVYFVPDDKKISDAM